MPLRKPKTKRAKKAAVKETMGEFKRGTLRSGSRKGPRVKSRRQAIAIAMKQSGQSRSSGGTKKSYRKRVEAAEL
jgi:hypothetical protein